MVMAGAIRTVRGDHGKGAAYIGGYSISSVVSASVGWSG